MTSVFKVIPEAFQHIDMQLLLKRVSTMLCVVNNSRIGEIAVIVLLSSVMETDSIKTVFLHAPFTLHTETLSLF